MLLHKQALRFYPRKQEPSWYNNFEGHYRHLPTDYSLICHAHQTGMGS